MRCNLEPPSMHEGSVRRSTMTTTVAERPRRLGLPVMSLFGGRDAEADFAEFVAARQ